MTFLRRFILTVCGNALAAATMLFLPAWAIDWWRAWVFVGLVAFSSAVTMIAVFARRPDLLDERFRPPIQKDQPLVDKVLMVIFIATFAGVIVSIPLEVHHLRLLPPTPIWLSTLGLLLFGAGWLALSLTYAQNAFAAPVVKSQHDRGHRVIDTGVYAFVRHPLYLGTGLIALGMSLWLESLLSTLLTLIPIAVLAVRAVFEERFLVRELEGYADYRERVRWRLLRWVW